MKLGPNDMHYFVQAIEKTSIDYPISKNDLLKRVKGIILQFQYCDNKNLSDVLQEFESEKFLCGTQVMQEYVRWTGKQ